MSTSTERARSQTTSPTPMGSIAQLVNTERYPLTTPSDPRWARAVTDARARLAATGCAVLRGFITPTVHRRIEDEVASIAGAAYYEERTVNVYNTALPSHLPVEHPARIPMTRGNAFVPRDLIPADFVIHRLYDSELFQLFLAACLEVPEVFPLADPLAGLCCSIVRPGREHPWHFDTNEFAVSLLIQEPVDGGLFEYCPGIRSAGDENLAEVRAVITGSSHDLVRQIRLRPGDLQLFRGRHSLHRVSRVEGTVARHAAILSYSESAGVVGRAERTRQLFGRLLPAHDGDSSRSDDLLD